MIHFLDSPDIDPHQLLCLYRQADWAQARSMEDTKAMLAHTDVVITAWDGPRLIGVGRVLTDYVFRASIWDVIVDRGYQDRDIGKGIIHRILTHPTLERVELFWLCTRRYQGFYAALGFSDKEQTGMVWDRRKHSLPLKE